MILRWNLLGRTMYTTIWMLMTFLLTLANCNDEPLLVMNVDVSAVPGGVSALVLRTQWNGAKGQTFTFDGSDRRIAMALPSDASGNVDLQVNGLDTMGCTIASALLSEPVPRGLGHYVERTVSLTLLANPLCTLKVIFDSGNGSVSSSPAGLSCKNTDPGVCEFDFAKGSSAQINATTDARLYATWNSPCHGPANACTVMITAPTEVHVAFMPRTCSSDGWCLTNPLSQNGVKSDLVALWGSDPSNVYAVGVGGSILRCGSDLSSCTVLTSGTTNDFRSVWGSDANNVYVVGIGGKILRCASGSNNCVTLNASGTTSDFRTVWGSDANNVYAVGQSGRVVRCAAGSNVCTVLTTGGISDELRGIWGSDESNVYVVGQNGRILRCASGSTTCMSLSTTSSDYFWAVWGSDPNNVYVVGIVGTILRCMRGSNMCVGLTSNTTTDLRAVWGSDASNVYAGGGSGEIVRCSSGSMSCTKLSTTSANLWAIGGVDINNVFAAGLNGTLRRCVSTSNTCVGLNSGSSNNLWGVWGSDIDNIYIVGDGGTILRYLP